MPSGISALFTDINPNDSENCKISPSRFIMLMDSVLDRPGTTNDGIQVSYATLFSNNSANYKLHLRHSKQANVWCADGSARAVSNGGLTSDYEVDETASATVNSRSCHENTVHCIAVHAIAFNGLRGTGHGIQLRNRRA